MYKEENRGFDKISSNKKKKLFDSFNTEEHQIYLKNKKEKQKRNERIAKFGVVGIIVVINAILYLPQLFSPSISDWMLTTLGQSGMLSGNFKIWQLFTSMWLHGGFFHLAINMFVFWSFGKIIEKIWASKKLLILYILSGIGGSLLGLLYSPLYPSIAISVGASGAICGLLGAAAVLFPDMKVYILFFIPAKIKPTAFWFGVISLFLAATNILPMIGHSVHLGGLIIGYLITLYWKEKGNLFTTFI